MKRIEEKMLRAIKDGRNWSESNTEVAHNNGVTKVYLHGNLIAKRVNAKWLYSLCGWNTLTTRSRLNVLGCNVVQRNFTPYRNGVEWWSDFE